ncbi:class I SAM-dependent methyltransferase [Candidatus Uhrbacteria bacterium]|nr:class I SAM-dependent methyltransferase [Candidatus Uhrbacteria bacterium]
MNNDFFGRFYFIRYGTGLSKEKTDKEVSFLSEYLPLKKYKKLLDFNCGIGRHAIEMSLSGYEVDGIDFDPSSIAIARKLSSERDARTAHFFIKDAIRFTTAKKYDAAYCLYSSIGYDEDSLNELTYYNLLSSVRAGGRIIIDLMNPEFAMNNIIKTSVKKKEFENERYIIRHQREILENPTKERNIMEFTLERTGEYWKKEYTLRLYTEDEIRNILSINNFYVFNIFGSFDKEAYSPQLERMIFVADKKYE